ncbi:MAG: hypothetical protein J6X58_03120 [Bacteroidales bacterium]|nr:hypothetical protein [Bacteroidales bacterium]
MKKYFLFAGMIAMLLTMSACGGSSNSDNDEGDAVESSSQKSKKGKKSTNQQVDIKKYDESAAAPAALRIYIDNSGSMKGYAEGSNAVFISAISDLQGMLTNETYFWGNSKPIDGNKLIGKVLNDNPFNGTDTPFPAIFGKMAREAAQTGNLEFIITDGIISPKNSEQQYLKESLGQVKNAIRDSLKQTPDIAVCVYRFTSGYSNNKANSFYYTYQNQKVKLKNVPMRPFYVIAVGKRANIQWMLDQMAENESLATYAKNDQRIIFGLHNHDPKISFSNKSQFTFGKGMLQLKKKSGDFKLMANMPDCLIKDLGEDFIKDAISKGVMLNGKEDKNIKGEVNGNSLCIKCAEIRKLKNAKNSITVKIKKTIPDIWIGFNSDDDSNIAKDPMQQTKSFALYTMLQGIYEATDAGKMLIDTEIKFSK